VVPAGTLRCGVMDSLCLLMIYEISGAWLSAFKYR